MPKKKPNEKLNIDIPYLPLKIKEGKFFYERSFGIGDPFEEIQWKTVTAAIKDDQGNVIFEQENVEAPSFWSQRAINIVAQKYFKGKFGTVGRENSIRQIVTRVVDKLAEWSVKDWDWYDDRSRESWIADLSWMLLNQVGSFNSPVWFNLGINENPQCSACFILGIEDSMESIANHQKTETMIFREGSGCGTNFSTLRSEKEYLSGGGKASGPVSFMKGFDKWAGTVKSGGKTRRSAKIAILNDTHPDILSFIKCKLEEEDKVQSLVKCGFSADPNDPKGAYSNADYQNSNHSVRLSDEFMKKVEKWVVSKEDSQWYFREVNTGHLYDPKGEPTMVSTLWETICQSAWRCGDPGVQFDDLHNAWHTCPKSGKLNSTNPCSEFTWIDNSACNLASLNLTKFLNDEQTSFDYELFSKASCCFLMAQELLIDNSSYPTKAIKDNSHNTRPLGLGITNLGSLFMLLGMPYGSDKSQTLAASVCSVQTGASYLTSSLLSSVLGPFSHFRKNKQAMLQIIKKHWEKSNITNLDPMKDGYYIWTKAFEFGSFYGFRNSQVTLCAPTGTLAFIMDCDTTGVEPELSLRKTKYLAGGGSVVLENRLVEQALINLDYKQEKILKILDYISQYNSVENCEDLDDCHKPIFKTSFGSYQLSTMDHLSVLAAIQPNISGSISKTINFTNEATTEDFSNCFLQAWKMGIKNVAPYRDGSKSYQPLMASSTTTPKGKESLKQILHGSRRSMPGQRPSVTKKIEMPTLEGYITVGTYDDGKPGEVFLTISKEGSMLRGLTDSFGILFSMALQYGCPVEKILDKLQGMSFEPQGWVPEGWFASSLMDYIAKWMRIHFANNVVMEVSECAKCVCGGNLIPTGPSCKICDKCGESIGGCGG